MVQGPAHIGTLASFRSHAGYGQIIADKNFSPGIRFPRPMFGPFHGLAGPAVRKNYFIDKGPGFFPEQCYLVIYKIGLTFPQGGKDNEDFPGIF
jgi:hypothetical protein